MSLLNGFRVVQVGGGMAAAVCGRMLADIGADVVCIEPDRTTPLGQYLQSRQGGRYTRGAADGGTDCV